MCTCVPQWLCQCMVLLCISILWLFWDFAPVVMFLHLECRRCSKPGRTPGDVCAADSNPIPTSGCAAAHSGHVPRLVYCKLPTKLQHNVTRTLTAPLTVTAFLWLSLLCCLLFCSCCTLLSWSISRLHLYVFSNTCYSRRNIFSLRPPAVVAFGIACCITSLTLLEINCSLMTNEAMGMMTTWRGTMFVGSSTFVAEHMQYKEQHAEW